jgi:hypothetical protein
VIDERYDKWEIRPARWRKDNYSGPFLRTVANFEEGRHWSRIADSPWWFNDPSRKRATYVYPNPSQQDLDFLARNKDHYKNPKNMARFWCGSVFGRGVHPQSTSFADGIICYTQAGWEAARNAYERKFYALRIFWESFGLYKMWDTVPRDEYAFALNWGNAKRHRFGHAAYGWPELCGWPRADAAWRPDPQADDWYSLMRSVRAKTYIILSQRETLPFDAMLADCYGARIIAPDIPLYRNLPLRNKVLYPVYCPRHNEAVFGLVEVREYLRGLLAPAAHGKQWL